MCKFRIRFRLVHCGTITSVTHTYVYLLVTDFAKFYTRIRNVMDSTSGVSETINRKYISDSTGVRIPIFAVLSSGQHIFKRIGTKFLKLSNADFVLSGKWDRKYKSDSSDVQIPLSVSISALWYNYTHNSIPIFTQILHAAQKCGRLDTYCLLDKPEIVFRF